MIPQPWIDSVREGLEQPAADPVHFRHRIRFAFNSHGLGDCVHAATALRLYVQRGYDVQIQVEDNKRWIWIAAGIPIYDGPDQLPIHPYYYPDYGKYFDLSTPDHLYAKVAHFFEIQELPKLGTKEQVWEMVCGQRIDATPFIPQEAHAEAEEFLQGLPSPIFVLHSKGTNWQAEKSIPDAIAFELIFKLLETGGSVVILDYDARVPVVTGHSRVRSIKAVGGGGWGHIGCDRLCALLQRVDLFIGVDSGPFHVAGMVPGAKALGVFRKIPPVRCCLPNPNATYLVPAKDHEHWATRGPEWKFAEYQGEEVTALDIAELAASLVTPGTGDSPGLSEQSVAGNYLYRRVGHDERPIELLAGGNIGKGAAGCERRWKIENSPVGPVVSIYGDGDRLIMHLRKSPDGVFKGAWLVHEKMPVELIPASTPEPPQQIATPANGGTLMAESVAGRYLYRRVGYDERTIELIHKAGPRILPGGHVGEGASTREQTWVLTNTPDGVAIGLFGENGGDTCWCRRSDDGVWRGRWLAFERMPIELIRVS